jgi:hypothetical protein
MSNMTYLNSVYRQPFPQKYITNFIYAHSLPFCIKWNVILYHQVNDPRFIFSIEDLNEWIISHFLYVDLTLYGHQICFYWDVELFTSLR